MQVTLTVLEVSADVGSFKDQVRVVKDDDDFYIALDLMKDNHTVEIGLTNREALMLSKVLKAFAQNDNNPNS